MVSHIGLAPLPQLQSEYTTIGEQVKALRERQDELDLAMTAKEQGYESGTTAFTKELPAESDRQSKHPRATKSKLGK